MNNLQRMSNLILDEAFGDELEARGFPWLMLIELATGMIGNCDNATAAQRAVQPGWRDYRRMWAKLRRDGMGLVDRHKLTSAFFKIAEDEGEEKVLAALNELSQDDMVIGK